MPRERPVAGPACQEKPLVRPTCPYRITDTGGRVEYTKAIGRTLVKEFGKSSP